MVDTVPAAPAAPTTSASTAPAIGATAGSQNTSTDQNGTNRGLPYYEKLRRELRDTLGKKRLMDKSMVSHGAIALDSFTPWNNLKQVPTYLIRRAQELLNDPHSQIGVLTAYW